MKYKACIHNNIWTVDCNNNGSTTCSEMNFAIFCIAKKRLFIDWKFCMLWKVQLFASMPGQRLFKPINFFKLCIFVTGLEFTDLYTIHTVLWLKIKLCDLKLVGCYGRCTKSIHYCKCVEFVLFWDWKEWFKRMPIAWKRKKIFFVNEERGE